MLFQQKIPQKGDISGFLRWKKWVCPAHSKNRRFFLVFTEQNSAFLRQKIKVHWFYPRMTVACNVLASCDKSSLQDELPDILSLTLVPLLLPLLCYSYRHPSITAVSLLPSHSHTSKSMFFFWNNTLCCMYLSHLKSFKSSWDLLNKTNSKTSSLFKALLSSSSWDIQ